MFHCGWICFSVKIGSLISGVISLASSLAILIYAPKANEISHLSLNNSDHIQSLKKQCIYFFSVMTVLVSTLLIIGVIKMNSKLIFAFLWIGFTQCVVFLPICITFITIESTSLGLLEDVLWTGVGFVINPIIQYNFLLLIYFYHRELLNQVDRRAGYEPIEELRI